MSPKTKTRDIRISPRQMVEAQEVHCPGCGRFLGLQAILYGVAQFKCANCGEMTTIDVLPDKG